MKLNSRSLACLISLSLATSSSAALLQVTISGVSSGEIGGNPFTDQPFTYTTVYDTENITSFSTPGPDGSFVVNNFGSITIGSTEISISDRSSHFVNPAFSTFGIGNHEVTIDHIIIPGGAEFATYDLTTPLGPINVANGFIDGNVSWNTTNGLLTLDDSFAANLTMEVTAIPEPSTSVLFLASVVPLLYRRRQ